MEFNCDILSDWFQRRYVRKQKRNYDINTKRFEWHSWFAWYPVRIKHGVCVWLVAIERRAVWTQALGWSSNTLEDIISEEKNKKEIMRDSPNKPYWAHWEYRK